MQSPSGSRFKKLPRTSHLSQFLSRHDDSLRSGFITRLDRSPVATKITAFVQALALNIAIFLFLICVSILSMLRGFSGTLPPKVVTTLWFTQNTIIISAIVVLMRSTTIPFFWGECRLRIKYGFRPTEIIIQKSPTPTLMLDHKAEKDYATEEQHMQHYWRSAIRAINPCRFYSKADALLSPEYWTLEYSVVLDALLHITSGDFEEDDLEFAIWKQDFDSIWTVCELWRMHEIMSDQQEIALFRAFLAESGKLELLTIWQNMLLSSSEEKIRERCSSPKAYQAMVDKFASEGLDYETVWSQVFERTWCSSRP